MSTMHRTIHTIAICLIVLLLMVGFTVPCRAAKQGESETGPSGVVSQYLHDWAVTGYASAYKDVTATVDVSSLSMNGSQVSAQALVAVTMTLKEESVSDIPTFRGMLSVLGMTHFDPSISLAAQLPASEEGLTEQQQAQARAQLRDWYEELSGYINTPFTANLMLTLNGKLMLDGSLDESSIQLFIADGPDLVPAEGVLPRPAAEREHEGVAQMQEILQESTVAQVPPNTADTYNQPYTYNHLVARDYANRWTSSTYGDPQYAHWHLDGTVTYYDTSKWNPAYNWYTGGDCINYVSQALTAGGLSQDAGWKPYTTAWLTLSSDPIKSFLPYMAPPKVGSVPEKGPLVLSTYEWASAGALRVWVTNTIPGTTAGDPKTAYHIAMITRNDGTLRLYSCHTDDQLNAPYSPPYYDQAKENLRLYYVVKGTYKLTYTVDANAGGYISGTTPQFVAQGASGTSVTAVPYRGYHFVKWTCDNGVDPPFVSPANPRTDYNATGDITVTATFAGNTGTVIISSGGNGTVSPTSVSQTFGAPGTTITATRATGYRFVSWSTTPYPPYVTIDDSSLPQTTFTTTSLMPDGGTATITATFALPPSVPVAVESVTGTLHFWFYGASTPVVYGASTMIPVVGDWNGDGTDEVGAVEQQSGALIWWLYGQSSPLSYGASTMIPVAGDWNGDGTDEVGAVEKQSGALIWWLYGQSSPSPTALLP